MTCRRYEALALLGLAAIADEVPELVLAPLLLVVIWIAPVWLALHLRINRHVDWLGRGVGEDDDDHREG